MRILATTRRASERRGRGDAQGGVTRLLATGGATALIVLLLALLSILPAAAQGDAIPVGDPPPAPTVYLPLINKTNGNTTGEDSLEVMITGSLFINDEPMFPSPPKPPAADDPLPLGPQPAPDPDQKAPGESPAEPPIESAAIDGWATILNDGFETIPWPFAGWKAYDVNGATNGNYFWDDDDFRPYRGGWSAWPANNALDPQTSNYPPGQRTWMIYGPFSLADAARATFTFQYWSQTELNYDWLGWFASADGSQFFGNWVSGDSRGWRPGVVDFAAVPGYGSMLGDDSVWIGFYFYSDSTTQLKGPFIDDIFIQKFNCPGQFTATWYNSLVRSPSTQRAVTCESYPFARNWGTGSSIWTAPDNWSLVMTATPFFNTSKTWTFRARSDDGVRVTVDGDIVIDAWYDQGGTVEHVGTKYLTAGTHQVVVEYYDRTGGAQLTTTWH